MRVDLAAVGIPLDGLTQLGEWQTGTAHLLQHHQRSNEAAVCAIVVGKVVVTAVLAGEHRPGFGHDSLHEAVAVLGAHARAATLGDNFPNRTRRDEVVENRGTWMTTQEHLGQDRRGGAARHRATQFVHQEHPVGITVERQTDIEATRNHTRLQIPLIGGLDRIGGVIRERAVELAVHDLQIDHVETVEHRRNHEAAHAIGRVGYHLQRAQRGHIDERQHVVGKIGEHVPFRDLARITHDGGVHGGTSQFAHIGKTALDTDRSRTGGAHLDAVVLRRIVRRREHGTG